MLPFKKGAFKFAKDLNLPLLPVTIVGSEKVLPKGTINLLPGEVEMKIHEPIWIDEGSDDNLEGVMDEARKVIKSGF